ncbi:MAG: T9SS type A sorting domain-containing protein [Ignavibacteria bacterium]|jgi:hypothetical protein
MMTSLLIFSRKIKNGNDTYLGTVNRGVNSYTDDSYTRTGNTSDYLLFYDVRPYYAPSDTLADANFSAVDYGVMLPKTNEKTEEELSPGLTINNYPNPFNPLTRITYQLPGKSLTNLSIYNSIGEIVTELINETKEKGAYHIDFNGNTLPSGVYYAVLKTSNDIKVSKVLLTK